jgi:hypothetical protein
MPTPDSYDARTARLRGRSVARPETRALARGLLASAAAAAVWLGPFGVMAQQDGPRVPRHASAELEHAARYMMSLPGKPDSVALAAQGTQEGHWRFVNRAGEMFTVGTPDEMKRVISVLYPEAKASARVLLYMTEDTVFRHRATLKALPAAADLNMVVRGRSYRLRRAGPDADRLLAEVRSNLGLEPRDARLFQEVLWHLARPLRDARVRVLTLQPGGPRALAAWPRIDPATRRAVVDAIDPASLAPAMGSVAGQMLVVVGRVEDGVLHVRPSSGPEHSLLVGDLFKAAAAADVNLIVLQTAATPRQPGARNGLWQSPHGSDAEAVLRPAQLADLLSGMAGPGRRLAVAASGAGGRTVLEMVASSDLPGSLPARSAANRLSGLVGELTARAVVTGVRASLLGAERQRELDRRLLAGIPAALQMGYIAAVALGLLGMPVARAWWSLIWPPESASEYAGRGGYWAACAVRGLAFLLLFMPMVAAAAAPYNLARQILEGVRAPGRTWRWRSGGDPHGDAPEPGARSRERPRFEDAGLAAPVQSGRKPGRRAARG